MEIKFSCTNPVCGQHIKADEAWAGRSLQCPACGATLQVPNSLNPPAVPGSPISISPSPTEIKFNCTHPGCGQRIAVDETYAGRWLKCPACGKPLQAPGTRIASAISLLTHPQKATLTVGEEIQSSLKKRFRPLWSLFLGWSLGAALFAILVGGLYLRARDVLPLHLNEMADEVFAPRVIRAVSPPNRDDTALFYAQDIKNGVGIFHLDLGTLVREQIGQAEDGDDSTELLGRGIWNNDRYKAFRLFGWSPDDQYWAYSTTSKKKDSQPSSCHL